MRKFSWVAVFVALHSTVCWGSDVQVLDPDLHHLRIAGPREWSDFPEQAEAELLELSFDCRANETDWTLELRHVDVKEAWKVSLNGKPLGSLERDENDMRSYLVIPKGTVSDGANQLTIAQDKRRMPKPDDVRIGQVSLHPSARSEVLSAATLELSVIDASTKTLLPARLTILDEHGTLQSTDAVSNDHLAVRPGTIYTARGQATCRLPAGTYTVYAGRGFEYSLDKQTVELKPGDSKQVALAIRREVPTAGYVACDTHVHTLTHSGHGDATVQERMITLAAEGIELPIATDHNVHIDHEPFAREMHVRQFFTPVIGNEVTTSTGHFNVFPIQPGAPAPDHQLSDWASIFDAIYATPGVKVAILNHARDIHRGVRPFDPSLFNDAAGENTKGWAMRFNAMEVINSSANRSDNRRLLLDWMALLNRGRVVTPVGSSDSHDVARHFVGQGRTYIRCDDRDPGKLDTDLAVQNFLSGRVMVSYGLLAELVVDGKYRSGELATSTGQPVVLTARVLGPHWVDADHVTLFANGVPIREESISPSRQGLPTGVLWSGSWTLPAPKHDVHYVLVASGPGTTQSYWRTARPYQATSPDFEPRWVGCSGAIWFDADQDRRPTPARLYAERLLAETGGELPDLLKRLADHDRSVSIQAAQLIADSGTPPVDDRLQALLKSAAEPVRAGFADYLGSWRRSQLSP